MNNDERTIGDNLSKIISVLGVTQKSLAAELGTTPVVINKYCNNKNVPGGQFLLKLCQLYDVNINYVLTGHGSMFIKKCTCSDRVTKIHKIETFLKNRKEPRLAKYVDEILNNLIDLLKSIHIDRNWVPFLA